jgi:NitT/TauT family transport system substrate-binding protein
MTGSAIRTALLSVTFAFTMNAALAQDVLKIAIGQRGGWEQCVSELGQKQGLFKKQRLELELLYTQGSAETMQSAISNSVDIGIGLGTHALLSAFLKGAPIRAVGASFTSADEQFYYVPTDSTIRSMKDAEGKSIAISTNGSASNMFAIHLAQHFGVNLKPQPTGAYAATLTQTLTKQVDIGFSQAPFNLNYVDDGRIRIVARGSDVPALRDMTSRLIVVNSAGLERRRDVFKRYFAAYRETLDWMYTDPGGDQGLRRMVGSAGIGRGPGAGIPDEAQHGPVSYFRPAEHSGRCRTIQVHSGTTDRGAAQGYVSRQ